MRILRAALLYFALVFGTGFLLGAIRTIWVVPRLGARVAELLEAPLMLVVSFLAARWVARRLSVPTHSTARLGVGFIALVFMLAAEFGLVLWLRGLTIRPYFTTRDPVGAAAYYVSLVVFAFMPLLVARKQP